jgi:hypothetical protein
MARAEIRFQRRFAMGLKRSFITNLKLIGLWKQYKLKESDFSVDFVTPILYDLYQQQKMIGAKMDAYKTVVDQEEFSKIIAMKKILKMTDEEIDENFKNLIKEKQLVQLADYYANKISDENRPLDYKSPIRLSGVDGETEEGSDEEKSENSGIDDSEGKTNDLDAGNEEGEEEAPSEEPESGNEEGEEEPSFGV